MSKSNPPKILFLMTGSIACFKACQVISKLVQSNFDVQVVMTSSALQFIGPATIEGLTGKPVISDLFTSGNVMDHIHLVRWADLIIVAPATANYINKISQGVGDDLATTLFLAHDFKKPFLLAPAMNTAMYLHPITQKSIQALKSIGLGILETASGVLACGEVGWGRLLEPDLIVEEIKNHLRSQPQATAPLDRKTDRKKILITSGGTQEPIDSVRSITNTSTGATGAFIAENLAQLGYEVTYLHAENAKHPNSEMHKFSFKSFHDLQKKLNDLLSTTEFDGIIHAAAVSDFSLADPVSGKISSQEDLTLHLKRNPKLVNEIKKISKNPQIKLVAFKMTANSSLKSQQDAVDKLFKQSAADLVVHNDTQEIIASSHPYHLYHSSKNIDSSVLCQNKMELAQHLSLFLSGGLS